MKKNHQKTLQTTKDSAKHTMKMKEAFEQMKSIYDDLSDLERADLEDFKYFEDYGKFD